MIYRKKTILIIIAVATAIIACFFCISEISDPTHEKLNVSNGKIFDTNLEKVVIDDDIFLVTVVQTKESRIKGLSGHISLDKDAGMLFVFEESGIHPFWMKDMDFAIDILWIDQNKRIIHIVSEIAPETFPKAFASQEEALYVLEIADGEAKRRGIHVGDMVVFRE